LLKCAQPRIEGRLSDSTARSEESLQRTGFTAQQSAENGGLQTRYSTSAADGWSTPAGPNLNDCCSAPRSSVSSRNEDEDGAAECGPLNSALVMTTDKVTSRIMTPKSAQRTRVLANIAESGTYNVTWAARQIRMSACSEVEARRHFLVPHTAILVNRHVCRLDWLRLILQRRMGGRRLHAAAGSVTDGGIKCRGCRRSCVP
jgi:hypothetical protein